MSVDRREIESTITHLVDLLRLETDQETRFRDLEYADHLWSQTVGATTDSALWALNEEHSINDLVELTGWKKWRIEAALTRHRKLNGLPVKKREREIRYIPLR